MTFFTRWVTRSCQQYAHSLSEFTRGHGVVTLPCAWSFMDVACGVSLDMAFLAGYGMLISQVIRPCMLPQLTSRLCVTFLVSHIS